MGVIEALDVVEDRNPRLDVRSPSRAVALSIAIDISSVDDTGRHTCIVTRRCRRAVKSVPAAGRCHRIAVMLPYSTRNDKLTRQRQPVE
jgi:hypothetical protein